MVGKLSNLWTTLGGAKSLLDKVLVRLKRGFKFEDVVQNTSGVDRGRKFSEVSRGGKRMGTKGSKLRQKIQLVVKSFVGKQNQKHLKGMRGGQGWR